MTKIFLNLHTKTRGNNRQHWRVDWQRTKTEREAAKWAVLAEKDRPPFPVKVTLVRCGPRKLDRHNIPSALKAVVDGIADAYGVDDGDDRWGFVFEQRKQSLYGVEIRIEAI
jgi:hypothetical protein